MKKTKIIGIAFVVMLLVIPAAALHYVLPQVDVVKIVNTEVKRTNVGSNSSSINNERAIDGNTDMYYIQTTDDGEPRVYRNEDNWFYLKFNSADQQALAQSFVNQNEEIYVAVRHYGWRVRLLSMFPNTVKIWRVEQGYTHIPIFNTLILILLAGLGFFLYKTSKRLRNSISGYSEKRKASKIEKENAKNSAAPTQKDTTAEDWLAEKPKSSSDSDT